MYTVINRTTKTTSTYKGNFPYGKLVSLLEDGNDLIVISSYSNTIKVPYLDEDSNNYNETKSSKDWLFKDYPYNPFIFLNNKKQKNVS